MLSSLARKDGMSLSPLFLTNLIKRDGVKPPVLFALHKLTLHTYIRSYRCPNTLFPLYLLIPLLVRLISVIVKSFVHTALRILFMVCVC
jgi:hypothetical protein